LSVGLDRPLVAKGSVEGPNYEAQCRGTSCPGRAEHAHANCRAWAGDFSARAADARRTCRPPESRNRKVVADHQVGQHQRRVTEPIFHNLSLGEWLKRSGLLSRPKRTGNEGRL